MILHISFKYQGSAEQHKRAMAFLASDFTNIPGLRWKIWMINEIRGEAGELYLFEEEASMHTFMEGPIAKEITNHPMIDQVSIRQYRVMDDVTAKTPGPMP